MKKKTHKGIKKRFKITKTGKIKFFRAGKTHILTKKTSARKRRLRKAKILNPSYAKIIKKLI